MTHKYYYDLKGMGIDIFDEKDIKNYCNELNSFDELTSQFNLLKNSFENKANERADIGIYRIPVSVEVSSLHVFHKLEKKFFSRKIIDNFFTISHDKETSDAYYIYFYKTYNFYEVREIFHDFIVNKKLPDVTKWEKTLITDYRE